MASDYDKLYFAAKNPEDTADILLNKANDWFNQLHMNGYLYKLRTLWSAYHGAYYSDFTDGHQITFAGEQGELVQLAVNHIRNIGQHMLNMITATRPALQARATNTDHKSLVQARLGNGVLDYYMREKRLEDYFKTSAEYSIALASGYLKMEWNSMIGEVYEVDDNGYEIREGDIEFTNLSPFDVVFDSNREDQHHDWVICRTFKNRFDIIAKYPEYEDEILGLPAKNEVQKTTLNMFHYDETDLIPVYEFYHRKSEAIPDGRFMLFLSKDIILLDGPMPYRDLPVYRMAPASILGTPYGYTPLFDLMPLQDGINSLYSTILTNQNAFGVQNLLVPRGADVAINSLTGGLNVVEANLNYGKVEPLNLTYTPREIFEFLKMLEQAIETISGINSVTRGQPEASLKSGSALALVQSMSIQFMSNLQHSYVKMIEDVGTGLINILKDHASVPRVATIVGKQNKTSIKEFNGDDLANINRVIVDIGNPLASTTAGRVEMAEQMLQMGIIKNAEEYFTVINTGRLDSMTEDTQSELLLIRAENERMTEGKVVQAIATDQHIMHINEHKYVLSDPDLRFDPQLVATVTSHIQEHIDLLRTTDPALLNIIGEQPLGPVDGSPANIQQTNVPQSATEGKLLPTVQQQQGSMPNLPNMPEPPAPFENAPVLPGDKIPE